MSEKLLSMKLGGLLDFKNGKISPKNSGNVPIYGGNGILGYTNEANYENVLIIGRVGAYCGSVHLEKGKCWVSDNAIAGIHLQVESNEYNYYLLKCIGLNKKQIGSSQPLLTQGILNKIDVSVHPDIRKRQAIASVLSSLDKKINMNKRINAELEATAKTIYDYWFVQFDFPNAQGRPYKSSGGEMEYSKELKREVPKGWSVKKMSDWIVADKSGDWGKETSEGNYVKKVTCVRGTDINSLNGLEVSDPPIRFILEKNSFKILASHDLIIEISGGSPTQSTGRMAFITDATLKRFDAPIICSNFCKAISIKEKKLLYNFVYYWNSLYDSGAFFGYEGKTSGIKNLLFDSFVNSYYTVVPEGEIVEKFYDFMENIQNKKQTAIAENQKLAELRDWLLPMLVNGQVKVV